MKRQSTFGWMFTLLLAAVTVTLMGCPKSPEISETRPGGPTSTTKTTPPPPPGGPSSEVRVTPPPGPREGTTTPSGPGSGTTGGATTRAPGGADAGPLKMIYFDYDTAALTDEARRTLNDNAAWLKSNAQARVSIEGHCDERGTSEYNLALGDRRAKAVRDYLVAAGIDGNRLRTISYGKERPLDPRHDESAWRVNRRAQFALAQ